MCSICIGNETDERELHFCMELLHSDRGRVVTVKIHLSTVLFIGAESAT